MRILIIACLVAACGKGDSNSSDKPSPAKPGSPPSGATGKPSVTGTVTISGALAGTFQWKDDLAITCGWVNDLGVGAFELTMTDGKDTFISIGGTKGNDVWNVKLSSGKLKDVLEQKGGGVTLTGSADNHQLSADVDANVTGRSDKATAATVKAKLDFTGC